MTQRANPSVNRALEAFKTAGAIAYAGGSTEGWISPFNETSHISIQDPAIDDAKLNSFEENSTTTSLTVTIDPGEGFVFGSWVAIDTETDVTLAPNAQDQTVYLGWNNNRADTVVIGLIDKFNTGPNDKDKRIPLYDFDTDGSGVTNVTDRRTIGKKIDANELLVDKTFGLPVYEESSNAKVKDGAAIYVDGSNSELEGIYVYDGAQWDRVARSNEEIADLANAFIVGGTGISTNYDSSTEQLTLNGATQYTDEMAQDAINALMVGGNAVDITYDDVNDELTVDIPNNSIQTDEIDENISPNWGGNHTFQNPIQQQSSPSADNEVATKKYVDSTDQGLDIKESVRVASTANIDLTSTTDPNPIDGVTLADGDRILLKDQTDGTTNGTYDAVTATDPSTWTRTSDADEDGEVSDGFFVYVQEGTVQQGHGYTLLNDPVLGSDVLTFTQFSDSGTLSAGDALVKSSDTIGHADTSTQGNFSSSNGRAITDINVDDYGHTTGISDTDLDQRYVEKSGDEITGTLTITGEIDASAASEIISATYDTLNDAQSASISESSIVYISGEESLYVKDSDGLVEIPTIEAVQTWVNNNADVPKADVARGFESRTDYPSNPSSGRVVFRTDKT